MSSPLQRVKQTLTIATNGIYQIQEVPELTCPTDGVHPIDVMFNAPGMGYVPLAKYFEHQLGEHLKVWARTALMAVVTYISMKPGKKVLVGGHAVLQPALMWAIAEAMMAYGEGFKTENACDIQKMALEVNLQECEALRLNIACHEAGVTRCEHITLD
ncbi:MAG TPA: hypothetical protein VJI33_00285 [Candidatus Paceibacterota bacterium]